MNAMHAGWIAWLITYGVIPLLIVALGLAVLRLLRGPDLLDRVLALDLIGMLGIGIAIAYAVLTQQTELLDVAMVLALLAFLTTVAFAAYVERRSQSWS